jgi:diguanylate cyclase (GGDEF)-like protein
MKWRSQKRDAQIMLLGILAPWLTVSLHNFGLDPLPHIDSTPFGFLVGGACLAWGFQHTGLLGVLRDVTDRRRAEDELARKTAYLKLIQEVALAANEAESVEAALQEAVRLVCERTGWVGGHVLMPPEDGSGELEDVGIFYAIEPERLEPILSAEELERVRAGTRLVARVHATGKPYIVSDLEALAEPHSRDGSSERSRLKSAMAMPVTISDEVPAVLEFGATEVVESQDELVGVLAHLGELLGRVIERKRTDEKIRKLAYHDALTGLPNRQLFQQRLQGAIEEAARYEHIVALLFIDLDGFKLINDTWGHSVGDALLRSVAERFAMCIRQSDLVGRSSAAVEEAISRLGGDEFTVLLSRIATPQDAATVANRLIESLSEALTIGHREVFTRASIGIAVYPGDGADAEMLLQSADAAMYEAKNRGANRYEFYTESLNRESRRRLQLEGLLRHAMDRDELSLNYQPFLDTATGAIVGAEALLRWNQPEEGNIPPVEFIPIAERTGLIRQIGMWVLRTATVQAMAWQAEGFRPIRIAVNVSGYQIRAGDFVQAVAAVLEESQLSPHYLELEITESAIRAEDPTTHRTLGELRKMGVSLSLDDFGTGSSSLTHLRILPIERVKIDRSFVNGVLDNEDDASLTAAIIAMAHGLRRRVIGEGVETEGQAEFLTSKGCDELQGYLISRPVSAEAFRHFLQREKPDS